MHTIWRSADGEPSAFAGWHGLERGPAMAQVAYGKPSCAADETRAIYMWTNIGTQSSLAQPARSRLERAMLLELRSRTVHRRSLASVN